MMKFLVSKKMMVGAGAALAVVGDALAYYFATATKEESFGNLFTYEVPAYSSDYVMGAAAMAIIGAVVLIMAAMAKN